MTALVTGATGFIGRDLVNRFLAENAAVRILTRGGRPLSASWAEKVEVVVGDLSDTTVLSSYLRGCSTVYHLAAELRDPAKMHATNVKGTENLLAACEVVGVRQVVHLSSVGVIGVHQPGIVDETTPCYPQNNYERSKYTAEQLALAWSERVGIPLIALRPTIVFGDGLRGNANTDNMLAWLSAIRSGRFVFFDHHAVANYVYVGDVVAACRLAGKSHATGIFIVADSCPLTDFVAAAAEAMGCAVPHWSIPLPVAYVLALGAQTLGSVLRWNSPLTVSRVRALSNRTLYDARRIHSVLGTWIETGWRAGLRTTVNWYLRTGQLA